MTMLGVLGILALLLVVPIGLALCGFWLWMLIDAIRNDRLDGTARLLWVLLVWFLPIIGSAIYFVAGRTATGTKAVSA